MLIKETVTRSGFRLIKGAPINKPKRLLINVPVINDLAESNKSKRWLGTWCKHIKSNEFGPFDDYKKVS